MVPKIRAVCYISSQYPGCAVCRSGMRGNGVLTGASALPVTAYTRYIPHLFIDGNNAKDPF